MVFCSLKDAYGDEWKSSRNHSMTPCQSSKFTSSDPYFDDQVQSGILDKLEKLEGQIEYFTAQSTGPKKTSQYTAPKPTTKENFTAAKTSNARLENIIHYSLMAIFGALVCENMF